MLVQTPSTPGYESALPPEFVRARTRSRPDVEWGLDMAPKATYTPIGSHITCVPDALYGWPLWQVRIIRQQFDPGFVPIFRRLVYRTPAGTELSFIHHGVARYDPMAKGNPAISSAPLPYGWNFERPNVIERWLAPKDRVSGSVRAKNNLPKAFVPWGDWVMSWVEDTYWEASAAEKSAYIEENGEEAVAAKERKFVESETAYGNKQEASYRRRQVDLIDHTDEKEARARAAGFSDFEPKPFVEVQGANL